MKVLVSKDSWESVLADLLPASFIIRPTWMDFKAHDCGKRISQLEETEINERMWLNINHTYATAKDLKVEILFSNNGGIVLDIDNNGWNFKSLEPKEVRHMLEDMDYE